VSPVPDVPLLPEPVPPAPVLPPPEPPVRLEPPELVVPAVLVVPRSPPVRIEPPVLVVPPLLPVLLPPLLHPDPAAVITNMNTRVSFTKTKHTRFDIVSPVAGDTGAIDALAPTRGIVTGNDRQENTAVGCGWVA